MRAVLEESIACLHHMARDQKGRKLFREVEEWIIVSICESLEINPNYLRRGLLKWREKQVEKQKEVKRHGEMSGLQHSVG